MERSELLMMVGKDRQKGKKNEKILLFSRVQFRKLQSFALPVSRQHGDIILSAQGDSDVCLV